MALARQWWGAPTRGEYPSLPPDQIPDGGAQKLTNFLTHFPGKIVPRGAIGGTANTENGSLAESVGGVAVATAAYNNTLFAAYRAGSAAPLVDPWRVPINKPQAAGELMVPSLETRAQALAAPGSTLTVNAPSATDVFGIRTLPALKSVFTSSLGGVATAVTGGVAPLTRVIKRYIGSSVTMATGPGFVQDLLYHYDRLFVLCARPPGGTDYDPGTLCWTKPGGTTDALDQVSDWQDPVSGLVNTIKIGNPVGGDFGVALGRAAGQLVILMRRSVWVLYGTSPDTFVLRQLRGSHGCVDPRSVVSVPEGVVFASQAGLELFDGTKFTLLSEPVSATWLEFSNRGPAADTINYGYIRVAELPNRYLHIALGVDPHLAGGTGGAERNWLYHMLTGAWIDMSSQIDNMGLGAPGAFTSCTVGSTDVTLWGGANWARADKLTFGLAPAVGARDRSGASSYNMKLQWRSSLENLGRRWEAVQMHRVMADYRHLWADAAPGNSAPWAGLSISDSGAVLASGFVLPGYQPLLAPLRKRPVFDANYECPRGDASMEFVADTGALATSLTGEAAVYGMGVEFEQQGRTRRL